MYLQYYINILHVVFKIIYYMKYILLDCYFPLSIKHFLRLFTVIFDIVFINIMDILSDLTEFSRILFQELKKKCLENLLFSVYCQKDLQEEIFSVVALIMRENMVLWDNGLRLRSSCSTNRCGWLLLMQYWQK